LGEPNPVSKGLGDPTPTIKYYDRFRSVIYPRI